MLDHFAPLFVVAVADAFLAGQSWLWHRGSSVSAKSGVRKGSAIILRRGMCCLSPTQGFGICVRGCGTLAAQLGAVPESRAAGGRTQALIYYLSDERRIMGHPMKSPAKERDQQDRDTDRPRYLPRDSEVVGSPSAAHGVRYYRAPEPRAVIPA
jgi:hypothetical protein